MTVEELNTAIRDLVETPDNVQQFADIASPEENWKRIDKNIKLPKHVGFTSRECPICFDEVRIIFDKFSSANYSVPFVCPHCKANLKIKFEFTGYTSEAYLENDDK